MITIRKATEEDAEAIAFVHVTAWQETYKGMMPAASLTACQSKNGPIAGVVS